MNATPVVSQRQLDTFFRAYVETALWSSTDENGESLDGLFTIDDLSDATRQVMREDCADFLAQHIDDVADDLSRAGHDFWLTRNRHGAGFWDGDWSEEIGKVLTQSSHNYGSVDLYAGDDGWIYC